jgi:ubiquinone/menaquinone biosynthesis C-methylase UbiE
MYLRRPRGMLLRRATSPMGEETRLQLYKDRLRRNLIKYTRKAFHMLPELDKPRILDIGCGSGIPTMELASLSQGEIIGIDIHQPSLDRLARKIKQAGLSDRVKAVNCSMLNMDFPDESFEIIWAEGSTHIIGFETALREWRRLLEPNGFLVVHDELGNIREKLKQVSNLGYDLLGYFVLGEETWWNEYFAPLEKQIYHMRMKHGNDPKVAALLDSEQREIDMVKQDPARHCSVYLIMKRR